MHTTQPHLSKIISVREGETTHQKIFSVWVKIHQSTVISLWKKKLLFHEDIHVELLTRNYGVYNFLLLYLQWRIMLLSWLRFIKLKVWRNRDTSRSCASTIFFTEKSILYILQKNRFIINESIPSYDQNFLDFFLSLNINIKEIFSHTWNV